jgi:hypothetical protein
MTTYDTPFAKLAAAAAVAALVGAAPVGGASAQQQDRSDWPQSLKVGTASQGGTYFIYGAGWAGLVQEMLGVATSTEVTGGPVQNFALVQSGDLDLAMTTMGPAYEAWTGNSPIAPGVEMKDVRATFPMYQTPFQIIALQGSGIDSVEDLEGKNVGVGPAGGTCGTYFPQFFEALGVSVSPQFGGASDLAGQLQDGLLDAFAFCAGLPIAAFSEIEAQNPVNIFSFSEEQIATLLEQFPSLAEFTVPADTYRSQQEDQPTVAMWNFGIAHKDIPESLVYEIMKVVLDNHDRMMQIHQSAEETMPENYDKNSFLPFHPGAVRYYKEKGFELSEDVLPPEA